MDKISPSKKIYIAKSKIQKAGRGVFAATKISQNEIIESCPVIEIPENQKEILKNSELVNYYFMWGKHLKKVAIALGFGSIYNHSYHPNATYKKHLNEKIIEFVAIRNIDKDEEITVNYNYGIPDDSSTLWIKSIKPAKLQRNG